MAKRPVKRTKKTVKRPKKTLKAKRSAKRSVKRQKPARRAPALKSKSSTSSKSAKTAKPAKAARKSAPRAKAKAPRIDRLRRTLAEEVDATVQMPPSSLDLNRRGTAVRSGRDAMRHARNERGGMNAVTAGDVDVDAEDAYFTGEEAPGGDNPTPDSDVVDDIGLALGVPYGDSEELKSVGKVEKRDKHRWELDPASAEDFKERK